MRLLGHGISKRQPSIRLADGKWQGSAICIWDACLLAYTIHRHRMSGGETAEFDTGLIEEANSHLESLDSIEKASKQVLTARMCIASLTYPGSALQAHCANLLLLQLSEIWIWLISSEETVRDQMLSMERMTIYFEVPQSHKAQNCCCGMSRPVCTAMWRTAGPAFAGTGLPSLLL